MKQMDYDQEIKALESGIARMQGQIDLLLMLKQAGAKVEIPDAPSASPAGTSDTTPDAQPAA